MAWLQGENSRLQCRRRPPSGDLAGTEWLPGLLEQDLLAGWRAHRARRFARATVGNRAGTTICSAGESRRRRRAVASAGLLALRLTCSGAICTRLEEDGDALREPMGL